MSHDHAAAKKFRDVVAAIARREIDKRFPPDRYAVVHELDEENRRAIVQYNGESPENLVSVPYNAVRPAHVGQWVRVGGSTGDRHITDTLGAGGDEVRAEEVMSQSPLPPKWLRPDMRLVETFSPALRDTALEDMVILSQGISGSVIRIPETMTISQVRFFIPKGTSGNVRVGLYRVTSAYDLELLTRTGNISASAGRKMADFTEAITLERGEEVWVAVHNLASDAIWVSGATFAELRYVDDPMDAITYYTEPMSALPSSLTNAQANKRYDRIFYLSLIRT